MDLFEIIRLIVLGVCAVTGLWLLWRGIIIVYWLCYQLNRVGVRCEAQEILNAHSQVSPRLAAEICYHLGVDPDFAKDDSRYGQYINDVMRIAPLAYILAGKGYDSSIFAANYYPDGDYWPFRFGVMYEARYGKEWVVWYKPDGTLDAQRWDGRYGIKRNMNIYESLERDMLRRLNQRQRH